MEQLKRRKKYKESRHEMVIFMKQKINKYNCLIILGWFARKPTEAHGRFGHDFDDISYLWGVLNGTGRNLSELWIC